ncbi:MAG: glycogen-binding domain-containing protein [Limisphaerales bacterium]
MFNVKSALKAGGRAAPKAVERKPTYSKIFRWSLPPEQTAAPSAVEIAGTFSNWKKLPMNRDVSGAWLLAVPHIPGHRTHHYMFFADGKPVQDPQSDGLAAPHGPEEEQFAIATPRGPRVFMLFAQTK